MATMRGGAVLSRPQPLGIFPFPAGLLLLPADGFSADARDHLMRGDLPAELPREWNFFGLAVRGDYTGALAAIEGDDAIACHNRMVLQSGPPGQKFPERDPVENNCDELSILSSAARYVLGAGEHPPSDAGLDGEFLAFALMLRATHAIENGDVASARQSLELAIAAARAVSPEFAAQLLGQLAGLEDNQREIGIPQCREAIAMAVGPASRSSPAVRHGSSGARRASVYSKPRKCIKKRSRCGICIERSPQSFALLQNNLALIYLAMPMNEGGDQLRMGIAVQSLREALKVYTRERFPEEWASARLNLANALQYIPTSHPEENLVRRHGVEEILDMASKKALRSRGTCAPCQQASLLLRLSALLGPQQKNRTTTISMAQ